MVIVSGKLLSPWAQEEHINFHNKAKAALNFLPTRPAYLTIINWFRNLSSDQQRRYYFHLHFAFAKTMIIIHEDPYCAKLSSNSDLCSNSEASLRAKVKNGFANYDSLILATRFAKQSQHNDRNLVFKLNIHISCDKRSLSFALQPLGCGGSLALYCVFAI